MRCCRARSNWRICRTQWRRRGRDDFLPVMSAPASLPHATEPTIAELLAARPQFSMHAMDGLLLEGVPLARIAAEAGTPVWVYSAGTMRGRLAELQAAMGGLAQIHYAMKANDHLAVLRLFAQGGCGADVVSEGELLRARAAGVAPEH